MVQNVFKRRRNWLLVRLNSSKITQCTADTFASNGLQLVDSRVDSRTDGCQTMLSFLKLSSIHVLSESLCVAILRSGTSALDARARASEIARIVLVVCDQLARLSFQKASTDILATSYIRLYMCKHACLMAIYMTLSYRSEVPTPLFTPISFGIRKIFPQLISTAQL
ncbi:unnamed protein product [Trichogramma brassicae]|uniref:Uncharacterized protein n=1 Tax=Trichogramma brassicae TaxID=86971 RepID=A0A6H5IH22_9HYME|nr:unnamed protein product [Trichogramma brassicae]